MNFVRFPVSATNIFPIANTKKGGQLVTEFNLRTINSVSTDESIQYMTGPSFVHSATDFEVKSQGYNDAFFADQDISGSSSVLTIMPGRGVINGHFVELLTPIEIDMTEAYALATKAGENLSGALTIGLRAMYSGETTMAGALLPESVKEIDVEDPEDSISALYEGVQVVILPSEEFILPIDSPKDPSLVTAHIKLAQFTYFNGAIKGLTNNYPEKCIMLPASRIGTVGGQGGGSASSEFISKKGLDPKKLYTYAGYSSKVNADGEEVIADTWCASMDALMVWDADPQLVPASSEDAIQPYNEATFGVYGNKVRLYLPHKQPDINGKEFIVDQTGAPQKYKAKSYELPVANFVNGTPGTVDAEYTNNVKNIKNMINNIYNLMLTKGVQRSYIDILSLDDDGNKPLPKINPKWNVGDYILVGTDNTVNESTETVTTWIRNPSTLYVVLPGIVIAPYGSGLEYLPEGIELANVTVSEEQLTELGIKPDSMLTLSAENFNKIIDLTANEYRGITGKDYFTINYSYTVTKPAEDTNGDGEVNDDDEPPQTELISKTVYYTAGQILPDSRIYTDPPIMLTGQIPLASTDQIGGFIDVEETALDQGYVHIDSNGNLVLLDYALLRSGVLAYQLGEDFTTPAGASYEEIQSLLNEYVNERVAFPDASHLETSEHPHVIYINLNLSAAESPTTLNIGDIDSRFGTSICLNIFGEIDANTIINISNCEKIRIGNIPISTNGGPQINLYRCNLYYDAGVLNWVRNIDNLQLWYEKYAVNDEDLSTLPDLMVDGLTVTEIGLPPAGQDVGYWTEDTPNDNHFRYALKSVTLDTHGMVTGCAVLVKNSSTPNVETGKVIISGKCDFPSGNGLDMPLARIDKPVKITGEFIVAYSSTYNSTSKRMLVQDTKFTMVTPYYDGLSISNNMAGKLVPGKIHFLCDVFYVSRTEGLDPPPQSLDGWDTQTYHMFEGYTLS